MKVTPDDLVKAIPVNVLIRKCETEYYGTCGIYYDVERKKFIVNVNIGNPHVEEYIFDTGERTEAADKFNSYISG